MPVAIHVIFFDITIATMRLHKATKYKLVTSLITLYELMNYPSTAIQHSGTLLMNVNVCMVKSVHGLYPKSSGTFSMNVIGFSPPYMSVQNRRSLGEPLIIHFEVNLFF